MKYALGLNPTTAVTYASCLSQHSARRGTNYLTLTVNRAADPSDVTYNVEVSGDLQTWSIGPPFTVTLTNIPSQLDVRDNTPRPEPPPVSSVYKHESVNVATALRRVRAATGPCIGS